MSPRSIMLGERKLFMRDKDDSSLSVYNGADAWFGVHSGARGVTGGDG